ncbi:MAG: hypothetical protein ACRCVE_01885 [Plesiomonas sp.]
MNQIDPFKANVQHEIKIYGVVSDGSCDGCIFDTLGDCSRPESMPTCSPNWKNGHNHIIYILQPEEDQ